LNAMRQRSATMRSTRRFFRDLKEDHLRELGLPLGARIKLLKAIAALPQGLAKANRAGSLFWLNRYLSGRPRPMLRMPETKIKGSAPLLGPITVV
jgi:hypothetical protein